MKYILLLLVILSIIGGILLYRFSNRKVETLYMISNISNPRQVFWINDYLYLVSEGKYYKYDIYKRDIQELGLINENEILDKELNIISYQNIEIKSEEEYATKIVTKGKEYQYHETIKPISAYGKKIIAIDNYPNSPERKYNLNLETNSIEPYTEIYSLSGENNIVISKGKKELITISKYNDVKEFFIDEKESKLAFIDNDGYLWIYIPAEILSKIL